MCCVCVNYIVNKPVKSRVVAEMMNDEVERIRRKAAGV